MKSAYRVHTVITYLSGHPIRERAIRDAGQHWKEREINATKWDVVVANDCEDALRLVRVHYSVPRVQVKRIYSLNHMGDITIPVELA